GPGERVALRRADDAQRQRRHDLVERPAHEGGIAKPLRVAAVRVDQDLVARHDDATRIDDERSQCKGYAFCMSTTLLDQLETMTIVVSDTGDFNSIAEFRPRDATTNPSLLQTAAQMPEYRELVDEALRWAHKTAVAGAPLKVVMDLANERLFVEFGLRILKIIPRRVSTQRDARLSWDTRGSDGKPLRCSNRS